LYTGEFGITGKATSNEAGGIKALIFICGGTWGCQFSELLLA